MQPFIFEAVTTAREALLAGSRGEGRSPLQSKVHYLAGGTTLIDLLKRNVMRPAHVVDINALGASDLGRIEANGQRPSARRPGAHGGGGRPRGDQSDLSGHRPVA
jgi:xanthine dehydrogenase YagS FAD-binding subunit